ncbi:MAG: SdrD B-like domain-containing protein, partial [bacterium]|nr:SdrD B-like domain-containing protein [bacterium]
MSVSAVPRPALDTRPWVNALLAVVLAFAAFFVASPPARAADIGSQLSEVEARIVGDVGWEGWNTRFGIEFNACVPDSANPDDTWTVTLPHQLDYTGADSLSITNPDDENEVWITIQIVGNVATYTLTEQGAAISNLCFQSSMGGLLRDTVEVGTETFQVSVGNVLVTSSEVTIVPPPEVGVPQEMRKSMWFENPNDECRTDSEECIRIALDTASGDHGVVTIVDEAQGNWDFACTTTHAEIIEVVGGEQVFSEIRPGMVSLRECSPTRLEVAVDTTGLSQTERVRFMVSLTPKAAGGSGGVLYENSADFTWEEGTEESGSFQTSAYIGGSATGAFINLTKLDSDGNDANTPEESVLLESGETGIVINVSNTGSQSLRNIVVSDVVTVGSGTVENLVCHFPNATAGLEWAGPFARGTTFQCFGDLVGVTGEHVNVASVTAVGDAGTPISSDDPYHAHPPAPPAEGSFAVVKTGTGTNVTEKTYTFTYTCTTDPVTEGSLTVLGDGTAVSAGVTLPVGTECVVTEDLASAEIPGYTLEIPAPQTVTIAEGEPIQVSFENVYTPIPSVSVGDLVWFDQDHDGIQGDDEEGIGGVVLTLVGPDGQPVTNVTGSIVGPATTGPDGLYQFVGLPTLADGESYTVILDASTLPDGMVPTLEEQGDDRSVDSSTGEASSWMDLSIDGASDPTLDFGFWLPSPAVSIVKADSDGNDANSAEDAVALTEGSANLVFTVVNTGNENLSNVVVADEVIAGGTVEGLTCIFPDGSEGRAWPGPFSAGAEFTCSASLTGVDGPHENVATVTGTGVQTGTEVSDSDPYHATLAPTP